MQTLIYIAVGLILLVLENLLRVCLPMGGSSPHLIFLLIIFFGFTGRALRNVLLAFCFGYAIDALNGNLPGLHAVVYVLCAAIMVGGRRLFYLRSVPFQVLAVTSITSLAAVLKFGLYNLFNIGRGARWEILRELPWQVLLNLLFGLVLFPLLFKIEDVTGPEERHETFSSISW